MCDGFGWSLAAPSPKSQACSSVEPSGSREPVESNWTVSGAVPFATSELATATGGAPEGGGGGLAVRDEQVAVDLSVDDCGTDDVARVVDRGGRREDPARRGDEVVQVEHPATRFPQEGVILIELEEARVDRREPGVAHDLARGVDVRALLVAEPPRYAAAVARGPHRLFFDLWSLVYDAPGVQRVAYRPVQDAVVRALARSRALAWVQGNAERLPFADGCFDAVVSAEAFHRFPDPELALAGFHRVLAARGRLLIAFVNPSFEALGRASRVVSRWLGEPFRWPTPDVLRRQVETAGFEVLRQRRIFRLPAPVLFPPVLTEAVRRD